MYTTQSYNQGNLTAEIIADILLEGEFRSLNRNPNTENGTQELHLEATRALNNLLLLHNGLRTPITFTGRKKEIEAITEIAQINKIYYQTVVSGKRRDFIYQDYYFNRDNGTITLNNDYSNKYTIIYTPRFPIIECEVVNLSICQKKESTETAEDFVDKFIKDNDTSLHKKIKANNIEEEYKRWLIEVVKNCEYTSNYKAFWYFPFYSPFSPKEQNLLEFIILKATLILKSRRGYANNLLTSSQQSRMNNAERDAISSRFSHFR